LPGEPDKSHKNLNLDICPSQGSLLLNNYLINYCYVHKSLNLKKSILVSHPYSTLPERREERDRFCSEDRVVYMTLYKTKAVI
jgi:hypothetical protein